MERKRTSIYTLRHCNVHIHFREEIQNEKNNNKKAHPKQKKEQVNDKLMRLLLFQTDRRVFLFCYSFLRTV